MNNKYFVLAKDVLGLQTNTEDFRWSYGITPPQYDQEEYAECVVGLELEVGNVEIEEGNNKLGKYHYFSGKPEGDSIFYQRPFFFGTELRIKVEGLVSGIPKITVNSPYYRYIQHRFMNLHSVGYILTDIASLMLLRRDYAPLHCSAFRHNDATVIVFAPPNTGKTLAAMTACIEFGADFIAEDLAITNGKTVYSVPWTSTFRYYDAVETSWYAKMVNRLTQKVPVLELAPTTKAKSVDTYLGSTERMLASSDVTHVVILERDETASVRAETLDEAYRKIVNLNRYEFNYHKAPVNVAYEFFNPSLNLDGAVRSERGILNQLIHHADEVLVVRSPKATEYARLIENAIG